MQRQGLSIHESARRLEMPYQTLRQLGVDGCTLRTATKFVLGSGYHLNFEDLLPPAELRRLKRKYLGVLVRKSARRDPA